MEIVGAAQYPKEWPWTENADGPRTMAQALELARQYGVLIPEDVEFIEDEWNLINEPDTEAQYLSWRPFVGQTITWSSLYAHTGKIVVKVRSRVLRSDEAIVAVIAHEMHELNNLRELFASSGGVMTSERLHDLIGWRIPRNLHDEAWDMADQLVRKMRGVQ